MSSNDYLLNYNISNSTSLFAVAAAIENCETENNQRCGWVNGFFEETVPSFSDFTFKEHFRMKRSTAEV